MRSGNHPSSSASDSTTLIISNGEMEDITKIVKSLEDSGLLLKGVCESLQNEAREQKGGFLSTLLGTLSAGLLGNILAGKGINRAGKGRGINIALYMQDNDITYFDSVGVEHIPKEIITFIGNKSKKTNIFRIQAYDSIMCGYFCIGFIDFMLARTNLQIFFHQITFEQMI